MDDCITVSVQGAIVIPAHLCEASGLKPNDKVLIQSTGDGILLRPITDDAFEIYSDERIVEFASDEQALSQLLLMSE